MEVIALLVHNDHIAGMKPSLVSEIGLVAFFILPDGGHHGRPTRLQNQFSHAHGRQRVTLLIHDGCGYPGNRLSHGAWFNGHGWQVGQADHAGFGHPPVVVGRQVNVFPDPEK